eukprot:Clim_evm43s225 gene=Clim_evmTU43s225
MDEDFMQIDQGASNGNGDTIFSEFADALNNSHDNNHITRVTPFSSLPAKSTSDNDFAQQLKQITNWASSWNRRQIEDAVDSLQSLGSVNIIEVLPMEVAHLVLSHLDFASLLECMRVCKRWYQITASPNLWRQIYEKRAKAEMDNYTPTEQEMQDPEVWRALCAMYTTVNRNWANDNYKKRQLVGHEHGVYCVQFDREKAISGSKDRTIRVWDLHTDRELKCLRGHSMSVLCLQYDDHKIVSGSSDSTLRIWDISTGETVCVLRGHTEPVLHLKFDERHIVSCSRDRTVRIWKLPPIDRARPLAQQLEGMENERPRVIHAHDSAVNVLQFDDVYIVTASGDRTIRVWDFESGTLLYTLHGHERGIACLQMCDGIIVSGSSDQKIFVWDLTTGRILKKIQGHQLLVRSLKFDGRYIVSGSYDKTIQVYDLWDEKVRLRITDIEKRVFNVQADWSTIICGCNDEVIRIFDFGVELPQLRRLF